MQRLGGFDAVLLKGFWSPEPGKERLLFEAPTYTALLEIMVDTLFCPSEAEEKQVECFGKPIQHPGMVTLIMRLSPMGATWPLRRDLLKVRRSLSSLGALCTRRCGRRAHTPDADVRCDSH